MGTITNGSRENYTNGTQYLPGQSVYRGDMALITLTASQLTDGRIYYGPANGTASRPIRSMWHRRAQKGDQFCTGGSYSGEICGWTVQGAGLTIKSGGNWVRNVVQSKSKTGWCARHGDSAGRCIP